MGIFNDIKNGIKATVDEALRASDRAERYSLILADIRAALNVQVIEPERLVQHVETMKAQRDYFEKEGRDWRARCEHAEKLQANAEQVILELRAENAKILAESNRRSKPLELSASFIEQNRTYSTFLEALVKVLEMDLFHLAGTDTVYMLGTIEERVRQAMTGETFLRQLGEEAGSLSATPTNAERYARVKQVVTGYRKAFAILEYAKQKTLGLPKPPGHE